MVTLEGWRRVATDCSTMRCKSLHSGSINPTKLGGGQSDIHVEKEWWSGGQVMQEPGSRWTRPRTSPTSVPRFPARPRFHDAPASGDPGHRQQAMEDQHTKASEFYSYLFIRKESLVISRRSHTATVLVQNPQPARPAMPLFPNPR